MSGINTNEDRAERARLALEVYKANDWRGRRGAMEPSAEEILEAVGDLLGDLHHLVDRVDPNKMEGLVKALTGRDAVWDVLTDRGEFHYSEEVAEEALEASGVESWTVGEAAAALERLHSGAREQERDEGPLFEAQMEARYPLRDDA